MLHAYESTAKQSSKCIIKLADDTTVIGQISSRDFTELADRGEVSDLVAWCQENNLALNTSKTKVMIVDGGDDELVPRQHLSPDGGILNG